MSDGLIPRRYAKALYKYAVENGDSQEIYELLKNLRYPSPMSTSTARRMR